MQKNEYLDDLGIPIEKYGTNFCNDEDSRDGVWELEREKYGFDARECWNLDASYAEWLYSHLMKFVEDADKVINLDFHKFDFKGDDYARCDFYGKELTQREAINYILEKLRLALKAEDFEEHLGEIKDATLMWAEIFPACWW